MASYLTKHGGGDDDNHNNPLNYDFYSTIKTGKHYYIGTRKNYIHDQRLYKCCRVIPITELSSYDQIDSNLGIPQQDLHLCTFKTPIIDAKNNKR